MTITKSPKHLRHKPIISVNDYQKKDGFYAPNSDTKALSIGIAQYDKKLISVKAWRHTGKKWSRESEEIPLHRTLDLSILIINSFLIATEKERPLLEFPNLQQIETIMR